MDREILRVSPNTEPMGEGIELNEFFEQALEVNPPWYVERVLFQRPPPPALRTS